MKHKLLVFMVIMTVLLSAVTAAVLFLQQTTEHGNGVVIVLSKTTYSAEKQYYELNDPLVRWTQSLLHDLNRVDSGVEFNTHAYVDDLYLDDCALFKPFRENPELLGIANFTYNHEYYTASIGFYDNFSFTIHSATPIIVLAWIALGSLWLGAGLRVCRGWLVG